MQLEFVLGDGNNGKTVHGLAKIIRVAGLPETQFAAGHNAIPRRHDEAVAGDFPEENQRIQFERGVEQQFGVVEAQPGLVVFVNDFSGDILGVEFALVPGLTEQPLAEEQA